MPQVTCKRHQEFMRFARAADVLGQRLSSHLCIFLRQWSQGRNRLPAMRRRGRVHEFRPEVRPYASSHIQRHRWKVGACYHSVVFKKSDISETRRIVTATSKHISWRYAGCLGLGDDAAMMAMGRFCGEARLVQPDWSMQYQWENLSHRAANVTGTI